MRTMMKKSGAVAAFTAALLVMALLVTTGCQETPLVVGDPEVGADMGIVHLTLGNPGARTIMPDHPIITRYDLAFTAGTETTVVPVTTGISTTTGAATVSISVAPGTYSLVVTGYVAYTSPTVNTPVARASTAIGTGNPGGIIITPYDDSVPPDLPPGPLPAGSTITIVSGAENPTITVTAKPLGSGNGTVSFTANLTGVTAAGGTGTMTFKELDGTLLTFGTGISNPETLGAGGTGGTTTVNRTLAAGQYVVEIQVTTTALGGFGFFDVVHVYPGMDSPETFIFSNRNLIYVAPGTSTGGISYIHPNDAFDVAFVVTGDGTATVPDFGTGEQGDHFKLSKSGVLPASKSVTLSLPSASITALGGVYTWYLGTHTSGDILDSNVALTINTADADGPFSTVETTRVVTLLGTINEGTPTDPILKTYTATFYVDIDL